ncbi:YD repeat-containing protein [Pectobacterium atrosepticum ICMP 1526]|nr:YD repeat-containing protein [Pectobacterium atrosepticum ICMP 1526]
MWHYRWDSRNQLRVVDTPTGERWADAPVKRSREVTDVPGADLNDVRYCP